MIRKPTNLLLSKILKSALVELTAAESELQLNFSQVSPTSFLTSSTCNYSVSLARANLYQYVALGKCHAVLGRLHRRARSVSRTGSFFDRALSACSSGSTKQIGLRLQGASMLKVRLDQSWENPFATISFST